MSAALNLQPPLANSLAQERRRSPRQETTCSALIRLSAALTFRCELRNLSLEAAQVLCEPCYALLIHPRTGPVNPLASRPLELSIAFPLAGTVRGFSTRCRVKYCEPLSSGTITEARMVLGLEFIDIEQGPRQLLANFLGALVD